MDADTTRTDRLLAVLQHALGHELPNQLIAVQGLARLLELEEGDRLGADGRVYLTRLAFGAQKAHELVAALAEVVRAGRQAAPPEVVDLAEVAAEAVAEVKHLAPGRSVEYHGLGQTLLLSAPRPALCKALLLLLRRAVTADGRPLCVELSARVVNGTAEIRVADDGAAIPPQPFTGAQGLDLFLVRQLVEAWGGTVRVEARPGGGTAFVVTCPLSAV